MTFLNKALTGGAYERLRCAGSLIVLRKTGEEIQHKVVRSGLLVSLIMPTADRRAFVPHAIRFFQRQDYANRELIVLDDGSVRSRIGPDSRRSADPLHPGPYRPYAATTLNNLGLLDRGQDRMEEACKEFAEALQTYRELAQKNPERPIGLT